MQAATSLRVRNGVEIKVYAVFQREADSQELRFLGNGLTRGRAEEIGKGMPRIVIVKTSATK